MNKPSESYIQTPEMEGAQDEVHETEGSYAADWFKDSVALAHDGFYAEITNLIDPKPGETIVDVGTGSGLQLVDLAVASPESNIIGTERTKVNMMMTHAFMSRIIHPGTISAFSDSRLQGAIDDCAFWERGSEMFKKSRDAIRASLKEKILLLDDNILYPQLLQEILPNGQLNAGILSMPGGSVSRVIEWPFKADVKTTQEKHQRIFDISNATRKAFYHFMAEHMQPGKGRIVVAERLAMNSSLDPRIAAMSNMRENMGESLSRYWFPDRFVFTDGDFTNTSVDLGIIHPKAKKIDYSAFETKIAIVRFNRTDVPFEEEPLKKPVRR